MCRRLIGLGLFILVFGLVGSVEAQFGKGQILVEWWLNFGGNAVDDVRNHADFPDNPHGSAMLNTFEVPRTKTGDLTVLEDNYGATVRGYLYPPADGDYTFWITSDNGSEFLLSTDENPDNSSIICMVSGTQWTGAREWDKFPDEQQSDPVTLQAGKKYYVEAIYKEGGGGDGVAVGWGGPTIGAGPVVIDGQYLSPVIRLSDYKSSQPNPADGAIVPDTWASLQWTAGYDAVSHDVYFGENFDDVEAGTGQAFRGNQTSGFFVVGFPGFPYPDGLILDTTYYWRIDEKDSTGTTHKGEVWSFTVPAKKALSPYPADGAALINPSVRLSWEGGFGAKLHYVYFGDDYDTVNNATGGAVQGTTTYDPGPLENEKTYYWRVDEFDITTTHKGDVWSFTTAPTGLGTIIHERWDDVASIAALKTDPRYPDHPDATEVLTEFSWDQDLENYGARIHGWLYVPTTGDYTFWLCSDDSGELWLSTDDDPSNVHLIAQESTYSNANIWGTGEEQSEPISLVAGSRYYIMALWREGSGGDHCMVAWKGPDIPIITIIDGAYLSPYEPVQAYGASPANNATGVTQMPVLEWTPGIYAVSHDVYFGTDAEVVRNATPASPEYKGTNALGDERFEPGQLAWETTYYWRIDESNDLHPDSPWIGNVWSFTTADFLVVDDMERYTDDDAAGETIWQSWIDGYGVADNGAQVGYLFPPYAEQTIVHGGSQSMPVLYDNSTGAANSEVVLTLTWPRDWTVEGIGSLSIWFRGIPDSVGSFVENPVGTYTMTGSGADIWNNGPVGNRHDEFHFAYKTLTGPGSITARVVSVENTNAWAKAGVMIRETLDGGSKHAFACITPENGVASQGRIGTGGDSFNTAESGITAPHWVKLERDMAGNFSVSHSADGATWVPVAGAIPTNIPMSSNVYVGLALTSHDAALTCEAVFSNVTTTGTVSGEWANQDIGIATNDAEPLYAAIANTGGAPAVVAYEDGRAATVDSWTEWRISLQAFADQGINLTDVDSIAVGLGSKGGASIGGSGTMYFDDIRLHRPDP